ncbi:NAD(P)-dependent oxidoreductase [Staphylococcus borealis]|uniref:NAD(P)-dependent oxidoreductase n=1 Tax=Staphylococcus borealis TaxID=2742203 RepID=UPI000FEFF2B2|nr:NAD(P)-dependent oxidoreductase [Staphylococcus borealis]MDM7863780.1 NAD(P)-dependent oxidoreductase [Staphylococcus borealis]MDM7882823.1 NAD(P)-dependent oxidoreductase [Staphylococcus borealis]RIO93106.1 hydroxyacid dehydrogenase [Staphylococcus haemolyticus]
MKIVSLKRLGEIESVLKSDYPELEFYFFKKAEDIPKALKEELNILIGYDGGVDANFINECPNLKWISWYATGVNSLPLETIKKRNIILTNSRGVQAKQVSEFVLAFILDDYKKMRTSYINQINKVYDSRLTGKRLSGERVLILGTGSLAQQTVKLLKPFNMTIVGISRSGKFKEGFDCIYKIEELEKNLNKADIIINTLPETNETYHLLLEKHFELMNDECLFINVGRGTVVNEKTLIKALSQNQIRHAYIDVFENEPLKPDNALYNIDNVTLTAHISGNDKNIKRDATKLFKKNLDYFLNKNDVIENKVDLYHGY